MVTTHGPHLMSSYGDSVRWDWGWGLFGTRPDSRLSSSISGRRILPLHIENRDKSTYIRSIHIYMHRGCILEQMRCKICRKCILRDGCKVKSLLHEGKRRKARNWSMHCPNYLLPNAHARRFDLIYDAELI